MRFRNLMTNTSLFFPRVRYIALENLMFLYRWCFTDAEIIDLWREGRLLEMRGLSSSIVFRHDAKVHRRREYAALLYNDGWLRVAVGLTGDASEEAYLLYSAFNSSGEPYEFAQIDAYFDFVQSRGPLDFLRDDVKQRMNTDIQRHYEFSKEHLKQQIKQTAKLELAKQELRVESLSAAAQAHLDDIRRRLRNAEDQSERDALVRLRQDIRKSLLEADSREIEAIRRSLNERQNVNLRIVTLFTLEWSVQKAG